MRWTNGQVTNVGFIRLVTDIFNWNLFYHSTFHWEDKNRTKWTPVLKPVLKSRLTSAPEQTWSWLGSVPGPVDWIPKLGKTEIKTKRQKRIFFKKWAFPASFSLFASFQYSTVGSKQMLNIKIGWLLDCRPLVSEATTLPTEPQPPPRIFKGRN